MSARIPRLTYAYIPETMVVHLGEPNEVAENVTLPFIDYIKNVASNELYPTWPENALRANIHAIVSFALNRQFTYWYGLRGYNFDITNSTQYDLAFVYKGATYDNISNIVDEIFNEYIIREGHIEPYFAQFCDGRVSQCDGMYQWGSVSLADEGYSPLEILQYYYGNDISIVSGAPQETFIANYKGYPFGLGYSGLDVMIMQFALRRIAKNFPSIPVITNIDGYYDEITEAAVLQFQNIFNLPPTGIVDKGTWYKIRNVFFAVTKTSELISEGILVEDILKEFSGVMFEGETRTRVYLLQYFLNIMASFFDTIPSVEINGYFGPETKNSVLEFQKTMKLPITGIVDQTTWNLLYKYILSIFTNIPNSVVLFPLFRSIPYPNIVYVIGMGIEEPGVFVIQQMLSYLSATMTDLPLISQDKVDGIFGPLTKEAVIAFQKKYGLEANGIVDEVTWNKMAEEYTRLRLQDEMYNNNY
ncbi:MAG: peptidoglycan-binding protein [Sedimentibacter sp.]